MSSTRDGATSLLPNDPRRRTHDQSARRHHETGAYEATGPDQRLLADNGVIHDYGVDTHQCAATNDAAVKNRGVADVGVFFESDLLGRKSVQHTIVLHVAARTDHDTTKVATQRSAGAHIATRPDDDVAYERRHGMHERGGIDDGNEAIETVDRHVLASS